MVDSGASTVMTPNAGFVQEGLGLGLRLRLQPIEMLGRRGFSSTFDLMNVRYYCRPFRHAAYVPIPDQTLPSLSAMADEGLSFTIWG